MNEKYSAEDDEALMRLAKKRLHEIKTGKAKTFGKSEFRVSMKKYGVK